MGWDGLCLGLHSLPVTHDKSEQSPKENADRLLFDVVACSMFWSFAAQYYKLQYIKEKVNWILNVQACKGLIILYIINDTKRAELDFTVFSDFLAVEDDIAYCCCSTCIS